MKNKLDRVSRSVKLRVNEEELLYKSMKNDFSMIDSITKSNTLCLFERFLVFLRNDKQFTGKCVHAGSSGEAGKNPAGLRSLFSL